GLVVVEAERVQLAPALAVVLALEQGPLLDAGVDDALVHRVEGDELRVGDVRRRREPPLVHRLDVPQVGQVRPVPAQVVAVEQVGRLGAGEQARAPAHAPRRQAEYVVDEQANLAPLPGAPAVRAGVQAAVESAGEDGAAVGLDDHGADEATFKGAVRHAPGGAPPGPLQDDQAVARADEQLPRRRGRRVDVRATMGEANGHAATLPARRSRGPATQHTTYRATGIVEVMAPAPAAPAMARATESPAGRSRWPRQEYDRGERSAGQGGRPQEAARASFLLGHSQHRRRGRLLDEEAAPAGDRAAQRGPLHGLSGLRAVVPGELHRELAGGHLSRPADPARAGPLGRVHRLRHLRAHLLEGSRLGRDPHGAHRRVRASHRHQDLAGYARAPAAGPLAAARRLPDLSGMSGVCPLTRWRTTDPAKAGSVVLLQARSGAARDYARPRY